MARRFSKGAWAFFFSRILMGGLAIVVCLPARGMAEGAKFVAVPSGFGAAVSEEWAPVEMIPGFQIGKYEVTWAEWREVRDWAVSEKTYPDLANTGNGSADDHPVRDVSWQEVILWCNARSEKEKLVPFYKVNGQIFRGPKSSAIGAYGNRAATGYRLPSRIEWDWAALGATQSGNHTFSGNHSTVPLADGRGTWPVGQKQANELGLFDMSGNVAELCMEVVDNTGDSVVVKGYSTRGGSFSSEPLPGLRPFSANATFENAFSGKEVGFRLVWGGNRSVFGGRRLVEAKDLTRPLLGMTAAAGVPVPENLRVIATNTPTLEWQVDKALPDGFPSGLTLNATTGVISGTPEKPGNYLLKLLAENEIGGDAVYLRLQIAPTPTKPPVISANRTHFGVVGADFRAFDSANAPEFELASESPTGYSAANLAPGLKIDPASGAISGKPKEVGTWTANITAANHLGNSTAPMDFRIERAPERVEGMAKVRGGTFPNGSPYSGKKVSDFLIATEDVSYRDYLEVADWAVKQGYEDVGVFVISDEQWRAPVRDRELPKADLAMWMNAKSEWDKWKPVYQKDGKAVKKSPATFEELAVDPTANGYRFPTEMEMAWLALKLPGYQESGNFRPARNAPPSPVRTIVPQIPRSSNPANSRPVTTKKSPAKSKAALSGPKAKKKSGIKKKGLKSKKPKSGKKKVGAKKR